MKLDIDSCETYYFDSDDIYYLLTHGYRTIFIYDYINKITILKR